MPPPATHLLPRLLQAAASISGRRKLLYAGISVHILLLLWFLWPSCAGPKPWPRVPTHLRFEPTAAAASSADLMLAQSTKKGLASSLAILVVAAPNAQLDGILSTWGAGVPNLHFAGQCKGCDVKTTAHESWFNLPAKVMEMWRVAEQQFPEADLFMKVDTDVYVFYDRLLQTLQEYKDSHGGQLPDYLGHVGRSYEEDKSLEYCGGGAGYVLSRKALQALVACKRPIESVPYEDSYIGLCMRDAGIRPVDCPRFSSGTWQERLQATVEESVGGSGREESGDKKMKRKDPQQQQQQRSELALPEDLLSPVTLHGYKSIYDMLALHALLHYDKASADTGRNWLPFKVTQP